jgi:tRNA(Phe) wybutosine-synthesizing methylase Tyw3
MHPLLGNIRSLTDDELNTKINELHNRYSQAYRNGPFQVLPQLQMLIEDFNNELSRRNAEKMKELQEKLDKAATKKKGDKGIKNIIDIQ